MLTLRRPTPEAIRDFLARERERPFSYPAVGATRPGEAPPPGFVFDRHRVRLGAGPETYARARAALRRWEMFRLGWVELCWPTTPVEEGATVAVLIRRLGVHALNAARIVYVVEETGGPVERLAFAYGTLPEHVERGEERFEVEWRRGGDGSVWYDVRAFSRPHHPVAWAAYPWVRLQQRRFARDSLAAMRRAVG